MGNKLNIAGQKFGRLTPLHATNERNNQGLILWECQCDCGNVVKLPGSYIKRGRVLSCGCLKSEMLIERNIQSGVQIQVGDCFGLLTVIQKLGLRKQNSRDKQENWSLCKCQCGNIIEVRDNNLKSGATRSCGCIHSQGEFVVAKLLRENNINFSQQYSFPDLKGHRGGLLRFDFAIFKNNKLYELIEFDGRQHIFGPDAKWKESYSLETLQQYDELKNQYCKEHHIKLIRIPYYDIDKISLEYLDLS